MICGATIFRPRQPATLRFTFAVTSAVVAANVGCAGAPVGWGGTDEVLFQTPDTIKIQWDGLTTSEAAVTQKAIAHCAATRRAATLVDASADTLTFGVIKSKTWRCRDEPSPRAGGAVPAPQ